MIMFKILHIKTINFLILDQKILFSMKTLLKVIIRNLGRNKILTIYSKKTNNCIKPIT
jgi:hypothetical protein